MLYEYQCPKNHTFSSFNTVENREYATCPVHKIVGTKIMSVPYVKFPVGEGYGGSVHENDIKKRYLRPDGSVGKKGDKFYEASASEGYY